MLNADENIRYSRQIITEHFGLEKQETLKNSKVLVIGAGGLGSSILYYLTAVGIGTLGIVDFDKIELTNLNRQILHRTEDIGKAKVKSASEKLKKLNPNVSINEYDIKLNNHNIETILEMYDVVVDATDNLTTRYLISDTCYQLNKPLIEGAVESFYGILMTIIPNETPCFRCLYPDCDVENEYGKKLSASEIGVLGVTPGVIGSLQAMEVVKVLTSTGSALKGRLLQFDGFTSSFREIPIKRKTDCPLCSKNKDNRKEI